MFVAPQPLTSIMPGCRGFSIFSRGNINANSWGMKITRRVSRSSCSTSKYVLEMKGYVAESF